MIKFNNGLGDGLTFSSNENFYIMYSINITIYRAGFAKKNLEIFWSTRVKYEPDGAYRVYLSVVYIPCD